jgi:hypothetical protein
MSSVALSQISDIIEIEIQKALNEKLTKYAEYVSSRYDISLRLLMQDLENLDNLVLQSPRNSMDLNDGKCKGIKTTGKRCTFAPKSYGYCTRHIDQRKIERPTVPPPTTTTVTITHNHSFSECLFKVGCPACEKSKRPSSKENLLIDL